MGGVGKASAPGIMVEIARIRVIETVLVVDDDEVFLRAIARAFERHGKRVLPTTTGSEAVAIARAEFPELACVDLQMPPPGGVEVVGLLDQLDSPMFILMLSGLFDTARTVASVQAGADDCMDKDGPRLVQNILRRVEFGLPLDVDWSHEPTLEQAKKNRVLRALDESCGNHTEAAERLGITRHGLQKMLKKWRGES